MTDDLFEGYKGPWKGKRYWHCMTSMPLWLGLTKEHQTAALEFRQMTREEEKSAILSYPYDTDNCKCRNCRYRRIFGK